MKTQQYLLSFLLILFIFSCHSENPISNSGDLKIISLSSNTVAIGDTLIINGEFFGTASDKKYIQLDSNTVINSKNCKLWANNVIHLIIPKNVKSGYLKIIDSLKVKDSISIEISPIPFFEYVKINEGKFIRGASNGMIDESPTKEITISKPFFMTKYEISQRLYEAVMDTNPSEPINIALPVVNVNWIDAVTFCNNLSEILGMEQYYVITGVDVTINSNANGWRLPTEAEWEYACRAGTSNDFYGNLSDIAWYGDNSGLKLHPSGTKKANDFGLFDMTGNAWEWCWDFYSADYYDLGTLIDPQGATSGKRRVLRGGSFYDGKSFARSSNRTIPNEMSNNVGFRIVRNVK